jgi:CheY-like chemotaxis protein
MPGLSGYRAVGKLKAEQKYIKVPVIFMTARVKDEEMYESLKPKGPSYFIPKTIEMDDFLKKLKEILGKK